jgi:hypothetical protein
MKQFMLAVICCTSLMACDNNKAKQEPTPSNNNVTTSNKDSISKPGNNTGKDSNTIKATNPANNATNKTALDEFPKDFKPSKTFKYDKADLHESLQIQMINKRKVAYILTGVNGSCEEYTIKGVATESNSKGESDIDADNNGYFVDEYFDEKNKGCTISLRLGIEEYNYRARYQIFGCIAEKACKDKTDSEILTSK